MLYSITAHDYLTMIFPHDVDSEPRMTRALDV